MSKPCWDVYGLVAADSDYVFYIGIAQDVEKRVAQHKADPNSAAYEAIRECGVKYVKFAHVHSKELAAHIERHLIVLCPHAMNRTGRKEIGEFWSSVDAKFGAPWWRREQDEWKFVESFGG
jgi:predicted GIY-YIG superfamily endonuclease